MNNSYIIADHCRAACMILSERVFPSGKQQGYIVRRLLRRMYGAMNRIGILDKSNDIIPQIVDSTIRIYTNSFPELAVSRDFIIEQMVAESTKYKAAIKNGEIAWNKAVQKKIEDPTRLAWDLYQSSGVPFEVSEEESSKHNYNIDIESLHLMIEEHAKQSQSSGIGQFKSGLADDSVHVTKLHTATHILHAVLRKLYGTEVKQNGSALTATKGRFDVSIPLDTIIDKNIIANEVQNIINSNSNISKDLMKSIDAINSGAIGLFGEKYPEEVSVFTISNSGNVYSKEICTGPHVTNTRECGKFNLIKISSIGSGKKRFEFNLTDE
jgi:alanyl-tRNA synthetase